MDSKLFFRFRSGTHGLNEELVRNSTIETVVQSLFFCECQCKSVEYVLWECLQLSISSKCI